MKRMLLRRMYCDEDENEEGQWETVRGKNYRKNNSRSKTRNLLNQKKNPNINNNSLDFHENKRNLNEKDFKNKQRRNIICDKEENQEIIDIENIDKNSLKNLMEKIHEMKNQLKKTRIFEENFPKFDVSIGKDDSFPFSFSFTNNDNVGVGKLFFDVERILCFGIGNFEFYRPALIQLSFLLLMREEIIPYYIDKYQMEMKIDISRKISSQAKNLNNLRQENLEKEIIESKLIPIDIYDPLFNQIEKHVLQKELNMNLLNKNDRGKHRISKTIQGKVLCFMPHCPMRLYSNFLWANWPDTDSESNQTNRQRGCIGHETKTQSLFKFDRETKNANESLVPPSEFKALPFLTSENVNKDFDKTILQSEDNKETKGGILENIHENSAKNEHVENQGRGPDEFNKKQIEAILAQDRCQGKVSPKEDNTTRPNLSKLILIGNSFEAYHENLRMRGKDKDESNVVLKLLPSIVEKKIKICKADESHCAGIGVAFSETHILSLQNLSNNLINSTNRPPEFNGPDPELY